MHSRRAQSRLFKRLKDKPIPGKHAMIAEEGMASWSNTWTYPTSNLNI
jgi:hypothetical protein